MSKGTNDVELASFECASSECDGIVIYHAESTEKLLMVHLFTTDAEATIDADFYVNLDAKTALELSETLKIWAEDVLRQKILGQS